MDFRAALPTALIALAAGLTAVLVAQDPPASADVPPTARLSLPVPTGPYHVGTTAAELPGPSRGRKLMVQVWYPTRVAHGNAAPYFPPKTAQFAAEAFHVPVQVINSIDTHAFSDATPASGTHPIVLFSPGENGLRSDSTALETELASRGFAVVGIDVPGESALVEYPDGHVVPGTWTDTGDASRAQAVRTRVADLGAVLHALPELDHRGLLHGVFDLSRVGMFGFSLGGATTADAIRVLPQIRAGVDLDGSLYEHALTTPTTRPFLLLARDGHTTQTDPSWQRAWTLFHGFRREIHVIGAGHENFDDNAGFIEALGLSAQYPADALGPIPPDRATAANRQILTAFFDRFVRGRSAGTGLLDNPQFFNPDLERLG